MEYDNAFIKKIVHETVEELKRNGMLKSYKDIAYTEITSILSAYYNTGESDPHVKQALKKIEGDTYSEIIPLYYRERYTIERLAEYFDVEVSTITRNKKRLCLAIYNSIQ